MFTYFTKLNSKMMIRGIGISPLRNVLKLFSVRPGVNYCTINQKDDTILSTENNDAHERKCRLQVALEFKKGNRVPDPDKITADEWTHLFNLPGANQRRKHLLYLYGQQASTCKENVEKAIRNEIIDLKKQIVLKKQKDNDHIIYGLGHNCFLNRINRQQMAKWMNLRLHRAKLFGQKMIIDCGFDDRMSNHERCETTWKLEKVFSENRTHKLPFDLYYFGGPSINDCLEKLTKRIPTLIKSSSMTEIHYDKCYTEMFPKNRLVMLTPDSPNELEYDFNDIYVVGGIVDKGPHEPLMLAKAKRLNIRTAKLPLRYLASAKRSNPEIPLDAVVAILRERQMKNDWDVIFDQFIPMADIKASIVERKRYKLRRGSDILKYKE